MYTAIRNRKLCIVHINDMRSGCSKTVVVATYLVRIDIFSGFCTNIRKKTPERFSAHKEFRTLFIIKSFNSYRITVAKMKFRRHNKTGIIDYKHWISKTILKCLIRNSSITSDALLPAHAATLSNIFAESLIQVKFEFVCSYTSALLGGKWLMVAEEILKAYTDQHYSGALRWLFEARQSNSVRPIFIGLKAKVYFHNKYLKCDEPIERTHVVVFQGGLNIVQILDD